MKSRLLKLFLATMIVASTTLYPSHFTTLLVEVPVAMAATENACMVTEFGSEPVCASNDLQLGSITNVTVLDPCDGSVGDTATINLSAYLDVGSNTRYDIWVWLWQPNSCVVSDIPWVNNDGDACGDVNASEDTTVIINNIVVQCIDTNNDGKLDLPYYISWDNNAGTVCSVPSDTVPGTTSKCNKWVYTLPDVVVPDEVCDGTDNDRDGLVDELFPDSDSDGIADCVDTCDYSNLTGTTCTPTTPNTNACGVVWWGTYNCEWVCVANPAPALPATYGQTCTSDTNMCGGSATGTYRLWWSL